MIRGVATVIGVALIVIGGVALARTGLDSPTETRAAVWLFDHTMLMALIDLGAGLAFILAAMSPAVRTLEIGLGALAAAFGAVVAIEPDMLDGAFGGGREIGYLYAAVGVLALIAALPAPRAARPLVQQTRSRS